MTQEQMEFQEWANQVTSLIRQMHKRVAELEWEVENTKARLAEWEAGPH